MQKRQAYTLTVNEKLALNKWLEKPTTRNGVRSNLSLQDRLSQLRSGDKRTANEMNNTCITTMVQMDHMH